MAGTLFVVATPIGHLDDMTARAIRTLAEVSVVAAEDTRRSGNLLRHFGIAARLISLHAHNERSRAPELVARLLAGESVALVSDAGTPGISDPGAELVALARAKGVRVEAVPGPSAVAAAVSVAGISGSGFVFLGFPPARSKDRKRWFGQLVRHNADMPVLFFEAPHRMRRTLEDLVDLVKNPILVFRELTKVHEETLEGTPRELLGRLTAPIGEFTVVVHPAETIEKTTLNVSDSFLRDEIGQLIENGATSRRGAARTLALRLGLSTRHVYNATKG